MLILKANNVYGQDTALRNNTVMLNMIGGEVVLELSPKRPSMQECGYEFW